MSRLPSRRPENPLKAVSRQADYDVKEKEHDEIDQRPSPSDFCAFLPWACGQMQLPQNVVVVKQLQNEYVSVIPDKRRQSKGKSKSRFQMAVRSDPDISSPDVKEGKSEEDFEPDESAVRITAVYSGEHLVQIKFTKNRHITREIFKLINMITHFYVLLQSITIDRGINFYIIHELKKILSSSTITEICLDNSFVAEGNYHILLDNPTRLRYLSLARCRIEDKAVIEIAAKLRHPLPASKTLCILNLSSNRITDTGVKHLAHALRTNRHLSYLNLASNMISDEGAREIFATLNRFPLTYDEIMLVKLTYVSYLRRKFKVIGEIIADFKDTNRNKTSFDKLKKKKMTQQNTPPPKKMKNEKEKVGTDLESYYYEKAEEMARDICGEYDDIVGTDCTVVGDALYCNGNNTLTYINLAYNSLSFNTILNLLDVLKYQRSLDRMPVGLTNICLEGNPLPSACEELAEIEEILQSGLNAFMPSKRKPASRRSDTAISKQHKSTG